MCILNTIITLRDKCNLKLPSQTEEHKRHESKKKGRKFSMLRNVEILHLLELGYRNL
jgi:hypothetical protein